MRGEVRGRCSEGKVLCCAAAAVHRTGERARTEQINSKTGRPRADAEREEGRRSGPLHFETKYRKMSGHIMIGQRLLI
eukprot:1624429-Rhodomonas_salina.2